jgi:hypothetical protein
MIPLGISQSSLFHRSAGAESECPVSILYFALNAHSICAPAALQNLIDLVPLEYYTVQTTPNVQNVQL